jgi:hypothetical protein
MPQTNSHSSFIPHPSPMRKNPFKNEKIKPNQTKSGHGKPTAHIPQTGWVEFRRDSTCLRQQAPRGMANSWIYNQRPWRLALPEIRNPTIRQSQKPNEFAKIQPNTI